ncbi:MAG: hypothetical protein J6S63_11135 [Atopobiaceae bacterium]|nr:hypothetical protein [Atopobiaceae bacterium]
MARKPTTFSMRMPEDLNEKIQAYATANNCTKAEAMSHFARAGIELEENGPTVVKEADTSADALGRIQERLEALQNLPTIEQTTTAIVPADIRDKIQTYSQEHECSEQEALAYYARIGIELSGDQRVATNQDITSLSQKIDLLAQDNQAKTEQLKVMTEMLASIREYTKPEEFVLEGELADPDVEDVVEEELSEEERQRILDEHTRQIVSDVMSDYMNKQRDEQMAREAERANLRQTTIWAPVLVAALVSLLIGLVIMLLR